MKGLPARTSTNNGLQFIVVTRSQAFEVDCNTPFRHFTGLKDIDFFVAKNQWDGAIYDREDTFQTILKKKSEIPYIEIVSVVTISFANDLPSEFSISVFLLITTETKDIPIKK